MARPGLSDTMYLSISFGILMRRLHSLRQSNTSVGFAAPQAYLSHCIH